MNEEDYTVSTGITKKIVDKITNKNRKDGWYWCKSDNEWSIYYYDLEDGWVEDANFGLYWDD